MTVSEAIANSVARPIVLAEVTAGIWCRAWVVDGTYTNTYKVTTSFTDRAGVVHSHNVVSVACDHVTTLTQKTSVAAVDASAGSWYHDGTYLWVRPPTADIFALAVVATVKFHFANSEKTLNDIYWEPRIASAPSVSQRIEGTFGEVTQVGGGTFDFYNNDGFFSELEGLFWDAGTVTLSIGVDTPAGEMAWADYEVLATWRIKEWSDDGDKFSVELLEPKARIKTKLPSATFTREDYPNIDEDKVGATIPMAYGYISGAVPICVDPGTKRFVIAGHAIKAYEGIRIKKDRAELVSRTTTGEEWLYISANVRRFYLADENIKVVTLDGTVLTEENDVASLGSGEFAYVENFVYVYAASWSGSTSVVIQSEQHTGSWITSNFETIDPSSGEFTLGVDWTVGEEVVVDFYGKVDSGGNYIENPIDIIEDLLTVAGETNLNSASFASARAKFVLGTDENNAEVNVMRPSIFQADQAEIQSIIGDVLRLCRSYMYSNNTGEYYVGVFSPSQGESLAEIDDSEIVSLDKRFSADELVTDVNAEYLRRELESVSQSVNETAEELQFAHDQPVPAVNTEELPTAFERDARYWAQAFLFMSGNPVAKHQLVTVWKHMRISPGDQIVINSTAYRTNSAYEVLEKRLDLNGLKVTLVLGEMRAFKDSPGHWVNDTDVLPSRFSTLAGYGTGSLAWNDSWDEEIKRWARLNVGYWTDANGFASTADAKSFNCSVWI